MNWLPPEEHYVFYKEESRNTAYFFTTIHDVGYKVVFKPSSYVFGEDKPYASLLYEFSVLAKFSGPQSYVRDELIAATVAVVFLHFYHLHDKNVCFYICDSSDGKQHVRKRKFDMWFQQYNRGAFIKLDQEIRDADGSRYPVAVIMRYENPFRIQVIEDFINIINSYNRDK